MTQTSAALVIYSATHSAAAVTTVLGIRPTTSGERADGLQRSFWRLKFTADGSSSAALQRLADALAGVSLEPLREHYVVQVRWSGPSRFTLPAPLVARIAELGDLVVATEDGILEHAVLHVTPGREDEFEAAFARARPIIEAAAGFRELTLARGVESPSQYVLLVRWDTVEDHEVGFRGSEDYQQWRALLHEFYEPFPVVEHFVDVPLCS